jgi:DNA polymerase-3 subunit epsilon
MSSTENIKYAVVDLETTGTNANTGKVTEIAILIHDGTKIIDEFVTLVNPECKIPYRITQITGINNRMVEHAPKFYEVAKKVIEITKDCVFVAHNVSFDYNFLRSEFNEFGYDYKREKLCTVKLSRKLIPGRRSYSLGNLTTDLDIPHGSKHRAEGDARATAHLLDILLSIEPDLSNLDLKGLNSNLNKQLVKELPEEPGVYYFHDDQGEIIYIGKSINIHKRILSHLTNNKTQRAIEMRHQVADITYELTGNELVALLLESDEIKKHMPKFNRAQRRTSYTYALYEFLDENSYINLCIDRSDAKKNPVTTFKNKASAQEFLYQLCETHNLCQKLCGLYKTSGACFHHSIHQCNGACIGEEAPEEYNDRVLAALERFEFEHQNFIIIEKGRINTEQAVILIENGNYSGFGFIDKDMINGNESLISCVKNYQDNKDIRQILRYYINSTVSKKIILI